MSNSGFMSQIEHVVHLMLENRALDNVLGWLYNDKTKTRPYHVIPEASDPDYDGLEVDKYSNPLKPHFWSPVTDYPVKKGLGDDGFYTPNLDPNEGYPNVLNQMFGDALTIVNTPPPPGKVAAMKGFLQDFDAYDDSWDETLQIMETYTPEDLPVLSALAKRYAVSDHWYSSMPTQTDPNRAFSLCGTSLGRLVNQNHAIEQYDTKTLFTALAEKRVTSAIYFHDIWQDGKCFTQYTFPQIDAIPSQVLSIGPIGSPDTNPPTGFYQLARAGQLPAFTYLEPKWGYGISRVLGVQGNDYHPPTDVRPGEALLANVYSALAANESAWKKTLFIITFDEHGGTYDHHAPPWGATNPGDPLSRNSPFKFDLFGVRVPTILVSPYIPEQTVFRSSTDVPYDHTSVIATLLRWKGIDPASAGLWERVSHAPTFEGVLQPEICNFPPITLTPPDGASEMRTRLDKHLKGVPAGVGKYIVMRSHSIRDIRRLVKEYRRSLASD